MRKSGLSLRQWAIMGGCHVLAAVGVFSSVAVLTSFDAHALYERIVSAPLADPPSVVWKWEPLFTHPSDVWPVLLTLLLIAFLATTAHMTTFVIANRLARYRGAPSYWSASDDTAFAAETRNRLDGEAIVRTARLSPIICPAAFALFVLWDDFVNANVTVWTGVDLYVVTLWCWIGLIPVIFFFAALRAVRRVTIDELAHDARCPQCGYRLTAESSAHCPECGGATNAPRRFEIRPYPLFGSGRAPRLLRGFVIAAMLLTPIVLPYILERFN